MAKPDATESELWQALEAAHIDEFVHAQSQELDLAIEQGASNLSGGQNSASPLRAHCCGSLPSTFSTKPPAASMWKAKL